MEKSKFSKMINNRTVLIAPLDWGLGHATRCIPIIKELLVRNFEVVIAASGPPAALLQNEFPDLEILTIDNYNIRYGKKKNAFSLKILTQFPKICASIRRENRWLSAILKKRNIDVVIADNRPGLYNKQTFCIYITHQINIQTGNTFTEKYARWAHRHFIKKFDECWIPDTATGSLAGALSYPPPECITARYIGPLSRFHLSEKKSVFDIAFLLSGPEPQRSILEARILHQVKNFSKNIIIVRGLPGDTSLPSGTPNVQIVNHLPAEALNEVICGATLVVSRSGYTSIMDYTKLRKKAVLIPTPGQPEQEYLAKYLAMKKYFLTRDQSTFDTEEAWQVAKTSDLHFPEIDFNEYKKVISALSGKIV